MDVCKVYLNICSVHFSVYTVSKPFDYLICTDDGRVLIKWTPLGSNPLLYPTESVTINGACVHEGKVMEVYYV